MNEKKKQAGQSFLADPRIMAPIGQGNTRANGGQCQRLTWTSTPDAACRMQ